ncbi:MAG: DNA cytosine methyltransferase [Bacteroidota bacterium]
MIVVGALMFHQLHDGGMLMQGYALRTAVDLYSGCGGLTTGMKRAGFRVVGAIENDASAARVYSANHPEVFLACKDIRDVEADEFRDRLGLSRGELTVLAACAPCQGFSRHRRGGSDLSKNLLVLEILRFVQAFLPLVVFIENVPELAKHPHRGILQQFREGLERLGYDRQCSKIVNAADYGVPQIRRRLTLLATRSRRVDVGIPAGDYANPRIALAQGKKPWRTVRQAIGHLPGVSAGERSSFHPLHVGPELSERNLARLRSVPRDGGSRSDLPEEYRLACHGRTTGYPDTYGRMKWDEPARTLTTGCTSITKGRYGHPEQDRALTPLEAALLQTFPLDYEFDSRPSVTARLVGNAVPVDLAYGIFRVLSDRIDSLTHRGNSVTAQLSAKVGLSRGEVTCRYAE